MTTDKQDVISLLADESFQRWLSGEASPAEDSQWREWLNADSSHGLLHAEARELWRAGQFRPAALPDVEAELQKLQQRLKMPATKTASIRSLPRTAAREVFPRFPFKISKKVSGLRYGAMAAAAILLLALLGRQLLPWRQPAWQTVSTANGERTRLQLPEGTTIILNANSTLRYPADWTEATTRRVELRGEAYFEVSQQAGRQHDFIVATNDGEVKVAGTRFVVYERGEGTRVAVEEGKVAVTVAGATNAVQTLLERGQVVQFQKNDLALIPQTAALGFYTTWWQDYFKLEDTPFEQIARRLEETYGVRVQVSDARLQQRTLSGAIENRDLDVIINALAKALGTTVHRDSNVVVFGHYRQQ
jgi:ferric-dicitrate binding protein FerR (iron transport regulator)